MRQRMSMRITFPGLISLLLLLSSGCDYKRSTAFYVEEAKLAQDGVHRQTRESLATAEPGSNRGPGDIYDPRVTDEHFGVTAHRIARGNGTVIAIRTFLATIPPLPDVTGFEKLTAYIPPGVLSSSGRIKLPDENVIVFWSEGGGNFPNVGCYGYATGGEIKYKRRSATKITIDWNINIGIVDGFSFSSCKPFVFNQRTPLKLKRIDELTPWEGVAGGHIYAESILLNY